MHADPATPSTRSSTEATGGPSADAGDGIKLAPASRTPRLASRLRGLAAEAIPRALLVRRGLGPERRIALTFDDGPNEMTGAYLDLLERFGARATFFVVGDACVARREALLQIVARGHEVASHGFTHTRFTVLDNHGLRDELGRMTALLPPSIGRALLRPPHGALSLRTLGICAAAGFTTVMWSRDSDDCRTRSPDALVARLGPGVVKPGEIVLLHEGQDWTLQALPRILGALGAAGWRAVTVGEILKPAALGSSGTIG